MMAWISTIFEKNDVARGSRAVNYGQITGFFCSFFIFAILNSKDNLNKWFFTENPIDKPLVTKQDYVLAFAVYIAVLNTCIALFVPEKKEEAVKENPEGKSTKSPLSVIKDCVKFLRRPDVKSYLCFLIPINFLKSFVDGPFTMKFIDLGFPTSYLQSLYFIRMPTEFLKMYASKYFVNDKKDLCKNRYYSWLLFVGVVVINNLLCYAYFKYTKDSSTVFWIWLIFGMITVVDQSFFIHMSIASSLVTQSKENPGTYQSTLGSIHNFSGTIATSLSLYLMAYMDYEWV